MLKNATAASIRSNQIMVNSGAAACTDAHQWKQAGIGRFNVVRVRTYDPMSNLQSGDCFKVCPSTSREMGEMRYGLFFRLAMLLPRWVAMAQVICLLEWMASTFLEQSVVSILATKSFS
jgi:hypothetical protein